MGEEREVQRGQSREVTALFTCRSALSPPSHVRSSTWLCSSILTGLSISQHRVFLLFSPHSRDEGPAEAAETPGVRPDDHDAAARRLHDAPAADASPTDADPREPLSSRCDAWHPDASRIWLPRREVHKVDKKEGGHQRIAKQRLSFEMRPRIIYLHNLLLQHLSRSLTMITQHASLPLT